MHRPMVLIIMDPRIRGEVEDGVCKRLGKRQWIRSEAVGFSGGIWVLWNQEEITLKILYAYKFFILALVVSSSGRRWEFTAIYASLRASIRRRLWTGPNKIKIEGPWVLLGDFNCVLNGGDRNKGGGESSSFVNWVEERGLLTWGSWVHATLGTTEPSWRLGDRGGLIRGCVKQSGGSCV